ncbi:MAG: anhydro-N-acetylmuramic acid kinase [Alphaproteobacteria bacterium]
MPPFPARTAAIALTAPLPPPADPAAALRARASEGVLALGLMSGTSLDGIDAALIRTDGVAVREIGAALTLPYEPALRERLRALLGGEGAPAEEAAVAQRLTEAHAEAVRGLLAQAGLAPAAVDVIGFHGHTILHRPKDGITRQIGDGALLAALTGIPVVGDFRSADVAAGGEGAPLVPLFHRALAMGLGAAKLDLPLTVLNLGGVANVTFIGSADDADLLAFDTGPGNAPIDDWVRHYTGQAFDDGGQLAAQGRVDEARLAILLDNPFFARQPPKSLDRNHFMTAAVAGLSVADGAATLAAFTAAAVARAVEHLPAAPKRWLVAGGGRHNAALMAALGARLGAPVQTVDELGWNGDALEAHAFGFLAARSLRGLPLSLPRTTGVAAPTSGGRLNLPTPV